MGTADHVTLLRLLIFHPYLGMLWNKTCFNFLWNYQIFLLAIIMASSLSAPLSALTIPFRWCLNQFRSVILIVYLNWASSFTRSRYSSGPSSNLSIFAEKEIMICSDQSIQYTATPFIYIQYLICFKINIPFHMINENHKWSYN